jgi:hypothetical protein
VVAAAAGVAVQAGQEGEAGAGAEDVAVQQQQRNARAIRLLSVTKVMRRVLEMRRLTGRSTGKWICGRLTQVR